MIDNSIYKALLLLHETFQTLKDSDNVNEEIKEILLNLTTYFVDLNLNINGVIDKNSKLINTLEIDEDMEKLINIIKDKGNIDNIDKSTLDKIMKEYADMLNSNNCNNYDYMSEETAEEVDKLIEELTIELGD